MCEEMIKFRKLLDQNKIEWEDMSETWPSIGTQKNVTINRTINRTHFYIDGVFVSVVNGFGTYGENHGLLEMWIQDITEDPIGYLTASDCWEEIKKILKKAEPAHDRK